ncbi:MAG: bifunctional riboflavin kinase/FMN adenylyltransferase [Alphaproteobacteria bacterium]|uniref:Riboflavin biosynthesis protein n=1 Tax=Candidatus Nitrobium versatile TaxID=2884831 RepID=A0A953JC08_9BACT|nr:bifunctional riboflavin kinase/FMN adenylyltransferase [Candidatus Nitrobium versatile]
MEVIKRISSKLHYPNPVVTIGNFDGVHLGHQKVFLKVAEKAAEINGTPIAVTFAPHPVRVLAPERGLKMITTLEEKRELIARMGIEVLICITFDKAFSHMTPDDFIRDVLVEKIGAHWAIVGHSYSFGKGKKGTTAMLRIRGKKYGFKVSVVRYAQLHGEKVSSSRVRSALSRGRVCEAACMLGRAYHIEGTVVKGAGRGGPLLHTPTANLSTSHELIPREGVYAVRVSMKGRPLPSGNGSETKRIWPPFSLHPSPGTEVFDGVANIGRNPTFPDGVMNYEVHIFGFNRNIVGERLRLHFIDRIRDEKKFSGIPELQEHIRRDIATAGTILDRKKNVPLFL